VGSRHINPIFLPSPQKVFETFVLLVFNGELGYSLLASLQRITIATCLSMLISVPIGLLTINFKFWDDLITPITGFLRFIPPTAFYPLLILTVGIDESMKISFLFLATFVYFLPSVVLALKEIDEHAVEAANVDGAGSVGMMTKIQLPMALPVICESFLMMYGIGWTYVIIAETINAKHGLGHLMNIASARGRTDIVFVAIFVIIVISFLFDSFGNHLIRKGFKWKFVQEEDE
jgi:NitT/TauT family transport system permease protein